MTERREGCGASLLVFLTCGEYDVDGNERAMFSTTGVDITGLYNIEIK
jgi:hypothetical protein